MPPPKCSFNSFKSLMETEMPWTNALGWIQGSIWEKGHVELIATNCKSWSRAGEKVATVSGPAQFTLADIALYAAIMTEIGLVPLAVTTDMNMHFISRPSLIEPLHVKALVRKSGRNLLIGSVDLEQNNKLVSMAVGTYVRPPGSYNNNMDMLS
jgi:acyl-coenzyme A thioesterase PaaI-like protein